MGLDPIRATQAITESYLGYLSTTYRLADEDLRGQLESNLRIPGKFVKGPILEATPPFKTGDSVADLVRQGVLSDSFWSLQSDELPMDRPLYQHQEEAIRKAVINDRNVVLATGTGSGKTEAFLVPILEHLFREEAKGSLGPGVRALLLYPMNALANDQVARLRKLLVNYPHVTFGRYTGETETREDQAIKKHVIMFHQEPLPNELVSRERMRQSPPHILLTNYAMLEYLLLRPADNVFFDGRYAKHWRFLVLDEAHTYTGAKGIETAMLLRRLKDRVVAGQCGALQCILTSATLGRGKEGFPDVARFAERLVGERVEWVEGDTARQDVIGATRKPMQALAPDRWKPDPQVYANWRRAIDNLPGDDVIPALVQEAERAGIPDETIQRASKSASGGGISEFLYEALKGDERVFYLRQALEREPRYLREVGGELFEGSVDPAQHVAALVELSARARPKGGGEPLIPARYHLFVRAIEGAYLALRPKRKLYLERRKRIKASGRTYAVFEIAVCRQCGAAYVVGEIDESTGRKVLKQPGKQYFDDPAGLEFYLLMESGTDEVPPDEDELVSYSEETANKPGEIFKLCPHCGSIGKEELLSPICECDPSSYVSVVHVPSKHGRVHSCPACGSRSPTGLVWRFLSGDDATASVLASALYEQIPPRSDDPGTSRFRDTDRETSDAWSSTATPPEVTQSGVQEPSGRRQLLIFSDSRQDAAFFAPYLNRTHGQIVRRRLILQTIHDHKDDVIRNAWRAQDLVDPLRREAQKFGLFAGMSKQGQINEARKWILYDLLAMGRRTGLEGLGCLGFALVQPERFRAPEPLVNQLGLDKEEIWTLFEVLLHTLRVKGVMLFPDYVSPEDDFFQPRNREYYVRGDSADPRGHIFAWNPSRRGVLNARLDFLLRLYERLGLDSSVEMCSRILRRIWSSGLDLHNPRSCWHDYFSAVSLPRQGDVYQLRWNLWELRASHIDDPRTKWYHCDTCNRLTLLNLRGVCPTYRCTGRLQPCDPADVFDGNHYRRLYMEASPVRLVAREHTAQLTSTAAAKLQIEFVEGRVNVLSCSTTFELGVDVGQLESVFMRNVPPSAANYVQRAGRAGRRTESTAFALTFAKRRSHDLSHFSEPKRLVSGEIRPPHFDLANEKIVRRHIYATALAAFWKEHPQTFDTVELFFFRQGRSGPELLASYLEGKPEKLRASLQSIVPAKLQQQLEIDTWGWTAGLLAEPDGVLSKAVAEVTNDIDMLVRARERLIRHNRSSDYILRSINTIKRRYLLSHLSSRNVIPKYGFPVDVIELQVLHHAEEAKDLELTRDLRIALSEYAPSSQVVAGGKLWTSRYLKKLPDRDWLRYDYAICDYCGCYQRVLSDSGQELKFCKACRKPLRGRSKGKFVIPEFGFITTHERPGKPGETRPERTYSTRVYYSGESKEEDHVRLKLGPVTLVAVPASEGQLAVINRAGGRRFKVCFACGYALRGDEPTPASHPTPWRSQCKYPLSPVCLGHEFKTDVLHLWFEGCGDSTRGFWLSLLYALLEGASAEMDIDRQDIDGCLYPYAGTPTRTALILYDDVPGGAGHVRRIAQDEASIRRVLEAAWSRLERCECGGDERNTSCYGCLRNYRNQFCHDELERGMVIDFLESIGVGGSR